MGYINWGQIEAKIIAYSKTQEGKEKMRSAVRALRNGNKSETAAGYELMTYEKMRKLADELIDMIRTEAASYGLADSVMAHFNSMTYMIEDSGDGDVTYHIYFDDDLSRPSLLPSKYVGIDNIVALFNNGYVASNRIFVKVNGIKVPSRQFRPTLSFMQSAVDSFIDKYSGKYNITVDLGDEYNGGVFDGSFNAGDILMGR